MDVNQIKITMLERTLLYTSCTLLMLTTHIQDLNAADSYTCKVIRNARDYIIQTQCEPKFISQYCQLFGADVNRSAKCECLCPYNKQTYMENTRQCTHKNEVWSGEYYLW